MAQKRRRGTTGTTVPMTRHGKEPAPSHNLQENSQARFCQLDTTTERRNEPAISQRTLTGTERARQEKTCQARRNHHSKESLEEARIDRNLSMHKASRVHETEPSATPEGGEERRPSIPAREPAAVAEDRSRQPEGQRGSGHPQKQAGTR